MKIIIYKIKNLLIKMQLFKKMQVYLILTLIFKFINLVYKSTKIRLFENPNSGIK